MEQPSKLGNSLVVAHHYPKCMYRVGVQPGVWVLCMDYTIRDAEFQVLRYLKSIEWPHTVELKDTRYVDGKVEGCKMVFV